MSSVVCGGQGILVKLGQLVSRPGYLRGFLTHPHQIHLPSCCSVLSQGILTPPLLGRGERLDLKIGSVVLPDLPLHANRRISFYPPLSHPCLYSVNPSRISLPSQLLMVLILRATVRLSGAKTQRSPSPRAPLQSVHIEPLCSRVLHPPFTMHLHKQTHFLACPTFVSTIL